jgi:uncharacterized protein YegL
MGNQQTTTSDSVNDVNPPMKSIESNKSSAASASLSKGTTMLNEDTAKIGGSSIQISDSNTLIPVNDLKPGTIEVVSVVGHKKVLTGVKTKVLVLLMVRTGPSNKEVDGNNSRPALHVSCVIDKSGSMAGSKLKFAKRGITKLIKHLNVPDCLHFVSYDSDVQTLFTNGDLSDVGKLQLRSTVNNIRPGSSTNLWGGTLRGAELVKESRLKAESSSNMNSTPVGAQRVFLFSDGQVNAGETNKQQILNNVDKLVEEGVTFSTFGIGTDFDEELMMGIAERGKGKYCFLRNSKEIPKLVSKSIHSLLAIAGSEASIQICGLNGAVVTKVYGVDDDDNDAIDNGLSMLSSMIGSSSNSGKSSSLGNITLGDLHTSNTRQVLVELEFSPSSKGELSLPVLEYTLQYTSTNSEISTLSKTTTTETITSLENPETVEETELKTSSSRSDSSRDGLEISGCVNVELTDDKNDSSFSLPANSFVAAALAVQITAEQDDHVIALLENGDRDAAITLKESMVMQLSDLHKQLSDTKASPSTIATLTQVLSRAKQTLEQLKASNTSSSAEMSMEIRYQQRSLRAMSDDGMMSGCDSDEGDYNDDLDSGGIPQYQQAVFGSSSVGLRTRTNDSMDSYITDDDETNSLGLRTRTNDSMDSI